MVVVSRDVQPFAFVCCDPRGVKLVAWIRFAFTRYSVMRMRFAAISVILSAKTLFTEESMETGGFESSTLGTASEARIIAST